MKALILFLLILQGSTYTIEVSDTGYAVISQEVYITAGEPMNSYTYLIPFPINHLEVYSDKSVKGEFTIYGNQTEIKLSISLEEGESVYCICDYVSWEIISKEGTEWRLYVPPAEEPISIFMPENAQVSYIVTESDFPSISDEKGKIQLIWEYLPHEAYIYYTLSIEENSDSYLIFIPLLGVLVGGLFLQRFIRKRKVKKLNKAVLSVLSERELKIVEYLHEKGRSRQAKISRDCQIPKTSLSKMLMKMEERGILRRERDGNLTYCELDENVYQ